MYKNTIQHQDIPQFLSYSLLTHLTHEINTDLSKLSFSIPSPYRHNNKTSCYTLPGTFQSLLPTSTTFCTYYPIEFSPQSYGMGIIAVLSAIYYTHKKMMRLELLLGPCNR